MDKPFLTVVTPTYNRRDSLERTLQGLARQSYPVGLWESVVVSDGATDGTDAYLQQAQSQLPFPLRPIFQANGGPSRARNRGIREAQGEVVVFLDDDVEPVPDFLARHAAHHKEHDSIAIIGPMLPDPSCRATEPVWIHWEHKMIMRQYENFQNGTWKYPGPNHFYSGNASVRRKHLLSVNGFDETFNRQEDVEMAYRLTRAHDVWYRYDHQAAGLHRPTRTFDGWLRVPYAYGQLDFERVERGDAEATLIYGAHQKRNRFTRLLWDVSFTLPPLAAPVRTLLVAASKTLYSMRRDGAALALLSAVYNVHYMEGVLAKMGRRDMRPFLRDGHFPTKPTPLPEGA